LVPDLAAFYTDPGATRSGMLRRAGRASPQRATCSGGADPLPPEELSNPAVICFSVPQQGVGGGHGLHKVS